jgi:hypothetical protein
MASIAPASAQVTVAAAADERSVKTPILIVFPLLPTDASVLLLSPAAVVAVFAAAVGAPEDAAVVEEPESTVPVHAVMEAVIAAANAKEIIFFI